MCFVALMLSAETPGIRVSLQPEQGRKSAPAFALKNAAGKDVTLADYRGKVLLLDFWATECGGCVREIPWFMDLARNYKKRGLAVAGISVDVMYEDLKGPQEAWDRVKPFVETHQVNYPILMGDDQVNKAYDTQALPLTYLIDKRGRIAAKYVGIVDKQNVEANIQAVLREHGN